MTTSATTTNATAGPTAALIGLRQATQIGATVLVGLVAGFFYTYEASVTPALAEVDDLTYVKTFQAINATIQNPAFGTVFFGSVPALVLALTANWNADSRTRLLVGAATALYLTMILITVTSNIPLNDQLAELLDVTAESATAARADFEADWNRFNLLRTVPAVGSFVCLALASFFSRRSNATSD